MVRLGPLSELSPPAENVVIEKRCSHCNAPIDPTKIQCRYCKTPHASLINPKTQEVGTMEWAQCHCAYCWKPVGPTAKKLYDYPHCDECIKFIATASKPTRKNAAAIRFRNIKQGLMPDGSPRPW